MRVNKSGLGFINKLYNDDCLTSWCTASMLKLHKVLRQWFYRYFMTIYLRYLLMSIFWQKHRVSRRVLICTLISWWSSPNVILHWWDGESSARVCLAWLLDIIVVKLFIIILVSYNKRVIVLRKIIILTYSLIWYLRYCVEEI